MDMNISGSGSIPAGEYENIKVSGSGRISAPVRCKSFRCSGSCRCDGDCQSEEITVSGSCHIEGALSSHTVSVSGSCHVGGHCTVSNNMRVSGSLRCDGKISANTIRVSGGLRASDIEAEQVSVAGSVHCDGLINAESVEFKMNGHSKAGSIGGSVITVYAEKQHRPSFLNWFFPSDGALTVKEEIEGDEVSLENTEAKTVTGRIVVIGKGCKIDTLRYSERAEISPDAKVKSSEKVD